MHPAEISSPDPSALQGVVGAIPARWGSTRLPGKALVQLAGRPMIEHVWRRAASVRGLDRVVVLTDDERIARTVSELGAEVEMTPSDCASGTDRIAWAARGWNCRAIVNIQGDEPLIDPEGIERISRHLLEHPHDPLVTLASDAEPGDLRDPNVVKVVVDRAGYALYFSRAGIPHPRSAEPAPVLRHLGIYGYQRDALLSLAGLEPTPLERVESLEQLRALEHGLAIRVLTGARVSRGVDTAEDAAAVAERLAGLSDPGGNR